MMKRRSATADWIVDLGPGAGVHGGEVVAQGALEDLEEAESQSPGRILRARKSSAGHRGRGAKPRDWK